MLRFALIGYGYWGPNVARNLYRNKNLKFEMICDKKQQRLNMAEELYGESIKYTLCDSDVIDNPDIDVVCLAVETSAHFELAKRALLAEKHIYVEKPFTDNVKQAEELRSIAKEKGLIIHVDHIMVYHPAIRTIKKLISSGEIGDIMWVNCSRYNLGQVKNDVNSMWDLSVHDLAVIDYLTEGATVSEVKAMGSCFYSTRESITQLMVKYDGFIAMLSASWVSPIKERRMIIAGTKKMIVYDDVDVVNKLIVYDKGFDMPDNMEYADYVVKSRNGDAWIPQIPVEDALYNSLDHCRQCVETGNESMTNADSAINVIKVLEEASKELRGDK